MTRNEKVKNISRSEKMCTVGTDVISEKNRENIQKKYYSPKKIGINGEKYCYHESESKVI